ncbi:MAG: hypothetical protein ACYTBV_21240 [Planctomycetota bacterium]|jgi:hypothetical protein
MSEVTSDEVDLDYVERVCLGLHDEFLVSFTGLPLKVDSSLEGSRCYIAVSPELLAEIKAKTNYGNYA